MEKCAVKRGEVIKIYGEVVIRQGDEIKAIARNKFVGQALITLCNMLSKVIIYTGAITNPTFFSDAVLTGVLGNKLTMRTGNNIATPTTYDLIKLVDLVDVAPNSFVVDRDNPSAGVYRAKWTATWNAGTLTGVLGELGLYCNIQKTLGSGTITEMSTATCLWSRLSSADGDFVSFTIDDTKPLSVEWRIVFQF